MGGILLSNIVVLGPRTPRTALQEYTPEADLRIKQRRKLGASDGTGWLESESLGRPPYWNHRKMTLTGDGKASLRIHPQSFDNERKGPLSIQGGTGVGDAATDLPKRQAVICNGYDKV
ncbi:hypothetical protein CABS01_13423 [Colletotrichum abscissum]|uniref:uncharacterized protein n=1 Tax=Colletotrichum abscissum TaxID=1671311 RepID=UPI0027D6BBF8|nr:uncharacterized protein CABS01_13423 [Colletotrichum abscissum]KAK1485730.1 hypothetical protein CABS01_13423 [Colletotrichum abscissum]